MLKKLGGRKFVFSLLGVISVFILVLTNKASVEQSIEFFKIILGIYVVGNVATKFAQNGGKKPS